ncbi:MAG TPA: alpha/beta hydrolase [Pseudonocardiaceae bacterium]|jgi:pimeloyl-ACP methyl ester carboxylesterase|nr:alpha/beta hydrolase [Pseudonocardiaceae bacterium]
MDVVLIAGLWLDGSAWADVAASSRSLGHRPVPLTLPGQDLDGQVAAVVAAVDAAAGKPVVVGHSMAATLAWLAVDARPDRVAAVVLVGGFPAADGRPYAEGFEIRGGVVPFPGWAAFEGPDSADLDEQTRSAIADAAIPVPEAVARGVVRLVDERRFGVPVVVVCPEFSPEQARKWIDAGEVPELARARDVEFVDIDSGHWPMYTKPAELAGILAAVASAQR